MNQNLLNTDYFPTLPPTHLPPLNLTCPASNGGEQSLTEILLSTTSAAETPTLEAKLLFGKIVKTLDEARDNRNLPEHLKNSFRDFISDLNIVAPSHFERHVKGTPRPPPYAISEEKGAAPNATVSSTYFPTVSPPQIKPTYATITEAPPPKLKYPLPAKPKNKIVPKPPSKKAEDYRLFVRVSEGHPAQIMSPYAVLLDLNSFLKENFIREIQVIKTGFAICPMSVSARDTLYSRMEEIEAYLSTRGECKVKKPTKHKAYLLSGIPRSYIGFNGSIADQINIIADMIAEAIHSLTNIAPISVLEPQHLYL